jgi:hypothetical protein
MISIIVNGTPIWRLRSAAKTSCVVSIATTADGALYCWVEFSARVRILVCKIAVETLPTVILSITRLILPDYYLGSVRKDLPERSPAIVPEIGEFADDFFTYAGERIRAKGNVRESDQVNDER